MSEPKSSPPRAKWSFPEEFKQDAVRLVTIQKYRFAAAAKALGISEQRLRRWHSLLAQKPEPFGESGTADELRAENHRGQKRCLLVRVSRRGFSQINVVARMALSATVASTGLCGPAGFSVADFMKSYSFMLSLAWGRKGAGD